MIRAQQSLVDVYHQVSLAKLPPPRITFNGLSHFNNKVLYMNPVQDDHLNVLARIAGMGDLIFIFVLNIYLIKRNLSRNV